MPERQDLLVAFLYLLFESDVANADLCWGRGVEQQAIRWLNSSEFDLNPMETALIAAEARAEICGFGPLDPVLRDPVVSKVYVDGSYAVVVDRNPKQNLRTNKRFWSRNHLDRILARLEARGGWSIERAAQGVVLVRESGAGPSERDD